MDEFEAVESLLARYRPVGPSGAATDRIAASLAQAATRPIWLWPAAAAVVASLMVAAWLWPSASPATSTTGVPEEFAVNWEQQARITLPWTTPDAAVVVVAFYDWLCAGCLDLYGEFEPILADYERNHPGAVRFVYEDYPWDSSCNPYTSMTMHAGACDLATAVRLAERRGDRRAYVDWIRANEPTWRTTGLPSEVASGNARASDFSEVLTAVRHSIDRGRAVRIVATPTFFINGVRLTTVKAQELDWAIRLELARALRR